MPRNFSELKSGGDNSYAVPRPEKWGDASPPSPTDRRPCLQSMKRRGTFDLIQCQDGAVLAVLSIDHTYGCCSVTLSIEFTLNPFLLRSRGVDEEESQSPTRVILRPISQILVNVTLKLVDACGHKSTSRKSIPIVYYPLPLARL